MVNEMIKNKIEQALPGSTVEVMDTRSRHPGGGGGGAHLQVNVKYAGFAGKSLLDQHRMVQEIVKPEIKERIIHAIIIKTEVQ